MRLNLGCGRRPMDGYVNVDRRQLGGTDVIADLDCGWPFADATIEEIQAWHVFEHVLDPCHFMTEAHRVLGQNGKLVIVSPVFTHVSAFTDPTHRRFCTPWTWDYWVPGTVYHDPESYGAADFAKDSVQLDQGQTALMVSMRKQ